MSMTLATIDALVMILNLAWYVVTFIAAFFIIGKCNDNETDENLRIIIQRLDDIQNQLAENAKGKDKQA